MANWQIHRFRDSVGIWAGAPETCYLTAESARAMAAALLAAARSIERERFTDSRGLTQSGDSLPDSDARGSIGFPEPLARLSDGRALRQSTGRPYWNRPSRPSKESA